MKYVLQDQENQFFQCLKYEKVTNVWREVPKMKPIVLYWDQKHRYELSGERVLGEYVWANTYTYILGVYCEES